MLQNKQHILGFKRFVKMVFLIIIIIERLFWHRCEVCKAIYCFYSGQNIQSESFLSCKRVKYNKNKVHMPQKTLNSTFKSWLIDTPTYNFHCYDL